MDSKLLGCEAVNWIHLAQDRDQWWALVNMVLKLHTPKKMETFLDQLSDYQLP
jgi:hypothetical protein